MKIVRILPFLFCASSVLKKCSLWASTLPWEQIEIPEVSIPWTIKSQGIIISKNRFYIIYDFNWQTSTKVDVQTPLTYAYGWIWKLLILLPCKSISTKFVRCSKASYSIILILLLLRSSLVDRAPKNLD
jgi:hypothetical protein